MALQPDQIDGYESFQAGMNSGVSSALTPPIQTRKNINVTLRNNVISPRPKFKEIKLEFFSQSKSNDRPYPGASTYKHIFETGRIQHVGKFQTENTDYIIYVVNGIIYAVDIKRCKIAVVDISETQIKSLNYNCFRINGTQANRFYVIFDWPNQPVYIDGTLKALRTKNSNQEIPRSYIGAFVSNRLFPANAGIEFGASDPVSPSNPLAPITFKESILADNNPSPQFPDQFFSLSYIDKLSGITAMGFLQQTDGTSPLGFGPLFVSTREAIHLFQVNEPRINWANIRFGSAYIFNYGIVGPRAFVNVGPDLFYRSIDGHIYSSGRLFSDQRQWGNTHISKEIEPNLLTLNSSLLKYSSMGYYHNRLFTTLKPYIAKVKSNTGLPIPQPVFNGIGVMEFNNITGVTSRGSSPVWAGIYPGKFLDMLEIDNKFYFISLNKGGRNSLLRYEENSNRDVLGLHSFPVRSRIYTKEFNFKSPILNKTLSHVYLDVRKIQGDFTAIVRFRINKSKKWEDLGIIHSKDCCDSNFCKGCIQDEFICKPSDLSVEFKSIEFSVDFIGEYYEVVRLLAIADLSTDLQESREFDKLSDECIFNTENLPGDNELCP